MRGCGIELHRGVEDQVLDHRLRVAVFAHIVHDLDERERVGDAPIGRAVDDHAGVAVLLDHLGDALGVELGKGVDRHAGVAARVQGVLDRLFRVVVHVDPLDCKAVHLDEVEDAQRAP